MKTLVLRIPEENHDFFLELIDKLGFVEVVKRHRSEAAKAKAKAKAKQEFLDDMRQAVEEVKLHKKGLLKLKSLEEVLNEL